LLHRGGEDTGSARTGGQFSRCCIEARTIRPTVERWMPKCAAMVA